MGSWDDGLLDNDDALDELGAIIDRIQGAALVIAETPKLTRAAAGELAVQLGLLVRFHGSAGELFDQRAGNKQAFALAQRLRAGVTRHRAALAVVAPEGKTALDAIASGKPLPEELSVAGLLRAKHAGGYLQSLADTSLETLVGDDIDQRAGAHLALLGVIAPLVELPRATLDEVMQRLRAERADSYAAVLKQIIVAAGARL